MRAAIFDMDGTLIDSSGMHTTIEEGVLRSYGLQVPRERFSSFSGRSEIDWLGQLKEESGASFDVDEVRAAFVARKVEEAPAIRFMPNAELLLDTLKAEGVRLALATGAAREFLERIRISLGLDRWFEAYVSSDDVARGKPSPDMFLEAARLLGVSPAECVVIEDGTSGLRAARAASMRSVAYRNREGPADLLISDLEELSVERLRSL